MTKLIRLESAIEPINEIIQADSGVLTVGREPENLVTVDSESVSRQHASLIETFGQWIFKDNESTNGSFINGTRMVPGQSRLLRDRDIIQLADFPIRFIEVDPAIPESDEASLLVFYNGNPEANFALSREVRFRIGGPEGNFFIEGVENEKPQLEIYYESERLELFAGGQDRVMVNGMAVRGVSSIHDRDEVVVGPYLIIVNDIRSAVATTAGQPPTISSFGPVGRGPAVSSEGMFNPAQGAAGEVDGWESEASRRRAQEGKRFVFGSEMEEPQVSQGPGFDPSATYGAGRNPSSSGFEMSASQRFSSAGMDAESPEQIHQRESRLAMLGAFVLFSVLVFFLYVVRILS